MSWFYHKKKYRGQTPSAVEAGCLPGKDNTIAGINKPQAGLEHGRCKAGALTN
jgi:hypothetical protein